MAASAAQAGSGVPGPLCVKGGGGVRAAPSCGILRYPPARGPPPASAAFSPGLRGVCFISPPSLGSSRRALLPHAPCLGFGSYRKGITIASPPTQTLRSLPSPAFNFLFFPRWALCFSALSSPVSRFPPTFRFSEPRRS